MKSFFFSLSLDHFWFRIEIFDVQRFITLLYLKFMWQEIHNMFTYNMAVIFGHFTSLNSNILKTLCLISGIKEKHIWWVKQFISMLQNVMVCHYMQNRHAHKLQKGVTKFVGIGKSIVLLYTRVKWTIQTVSKSLLNLQKKNAHWFFLLVVCDFMVPKIY